MLAETILDEDALYRRLAPDHIKPDGTVASPAYMIRGVPDDQISVHLARLTTPVAALRAANRLHFGIGSMIARFPRSIGFEVRRDPQPEDGSHSLICGENSKTKCRQLAGQTSVILRPGAALIDEL